MTTAVPPPRAPGPRRPAHPARWIAGAVLGVLVVVAVVAATRPSYQATAANPPLLGKPAPSFSGRAFDGSTVRLSGLRGRYVFVNFFASWCAPCQQEQPNLVQFAFEQQHSAGGAALISVVYQDSDAAARQFVRSSGEAWPALPDPGGGIANSYGITSPPSTFLIDPQGRVVGDLIGPAQVFQLRDLLANARRAEG
jgi:cytochrome c biogenesis protein CcmG/thiol:disulfide interchange protein DsbE